MTETMLAPTARWISTPKPMVRAGMTRMPPPTPASAPMRPAATLIANIPRSAPGLIQLEPQGSPSGSPLLAYLRNYAIDAIVDHARPDRRSRQEASMNDMRYRDAERDQLHAEVCRVRLPRVIASLEVESK